jgi:hypothetical protein
MPVYFCQKCETSIDVPEELSPQDKNEIATYAKRSVIQAIHLIISRCHFQLGEAHALALHLTQKDRVCHRCEMKQDEQETTVCPKCKALNLNWAN